MTKSIKRLVCFLLVLLMTLSVFASCTIEEGEGGGTEDTGSGTGTEEASGSGDDGTDSESETDSENETDPTSETYTIRFVDHDGTLISEQKLKEGETPVFIGQAPTRVEDDENTYTFAGWDKELAAVTEDATYTATYTATPKKASYTIVFYDEDGTTVLLSLTLEKGAAITAPQDPDKASTATNSFEFAGWTLKGTDEVVTVDAKATADREYVAKYTATELKYTITFVDEDGNRIGDPIKVTPGQSFTAPADPAKAEDAQYTYTFSGWTPELALTPTADATYTAVFTKALRTYDVVFYAADGETVLYTDEDVAYGEMPVYGGEAPVKIELGYWKFVGWNFELEAVNGENISYQATFNKVYDFKMETVTATDENGNKFLAVSNSNDVIQGNIQKDTQYLFTLSAAGEDYADEVDYTKHENLSFTIMFNYAGIELTDLDGNRIATSAKEAPIKLTVTSEGKIYVDDTLVEDASMKDGVVSFYINRDAVAHAYSYAEFTLVEYDVEIKEKVWVPLDADLTSGMSGTTAAGTVDAAAEALGITSVTEYTFTGSFQNAGFVGLDLTQYEIVKFYLCRPTVGGGGAVYETADGGNALVYLNGIERLDKWVGIELRKGDSGYEIYVDGAKAAFTLKDGAVLTNLNQLALNGSSGVIKYSNIMAVKFDDVKYYTVTFKNDDGTVLKTEELQEGAIPTAPAAPAKDPTAELIYTFAGWDKEIEAVTGDVTYTAAYTSAARQYTIIFENADGTVLDTKAYGLGAEITVPEDPTRAATAEWTYTFAGWAIKGTEEVVTVDAAVAADRTYVAVYTAVKNKYTVIWKNGETTLQTDENVEYGTVPTYNGEAPAKAEDNENTYAFAGWEPSVDAITGDTTYTATFTATKKEYTIKFYKEDGMTEIETLTLNWGDAITKPATPIKPTDTSSYEFAGWTLKGSDDVVEVDATVAGNREYVAKFNATEIKYTIIFQYEDGTRIGEPIYVVPGQSFEAPDDPEKAEDNEYTYEFAGWDTTPVLAPTADATYTATFTPTKKNYTIKFYKEDGTTEIETLTLNWNAAITAPQAPEKEATAEYTYSFAGWTLKGSDEVVEVDATVAGNREYVAKYTAVNAAVVVELTIADDGTLSGEGVTGQTVTLPTTKVWNLSEVNAVTVTVALTDSSKAASALTVNGVAIGSTESLVKINNALYLVGHPNYSAAGQVSFKIAYIQDQFYWNTDTTVNVKNLPGEGVEAGQYNLATKADSKITSSTGVSAYHANTQKINSVWYDNWRLSLNKSGMGSISFYLTFNYAGGMLYAKGGIGDSSKLIYTFAANDVILVTILKDGSVLINGVDSGVDTDNTSYALDFYNGGSANTYGSLGISTVFWRYNSVAAPEIPEVPVVPEAPERSDVELTIAADGALSGEGVTGQTVTLPTTKAWNLSEVNAVTVTVALTDVSATPKSLSINGVKISGTNQIVINAVPYLVGAVDTSVAGQVSFKLAYIQDNLYFGNGAANDGSTALVHTVALKADGDEDTKIAANVASDQAQINSKDVDTTGTGILYNKFNVEKDSTNTACYNWRLYTTKSAGAISFYIGSNQAITIRGKGDINDPSAEAYTLEKDKAHLITILADGTVLVNGVDTGIVTSKGASYKNATDTVEGFCLDMTFGGQYAGFYMSTVYWRYNVV